MSATLTCLQIDSKDNQDGCLQNWYRTLLNIFIVHSKNLELAMESFKQDARHNLVESSLLEAIRWYRKFVTITWEHVIVAVM